MKEKMANWLLLIGVFLLPWQTQWIAVSQLNAGGVSDYGRLALGVSQVIILLVTCLRGRPHYTTEQTRVVQAEYVFLGVVFFSIAFTRFFSVGIAQALQIIFAFFLFTNLCDRRTHHKEVVMAFICGLLVPVMLGWWQVLTGHSPESMWLGLAYQDAHVVGTAVVETDTGRQLRAYGSFPHPNIFGGYLVVGLLVLFGRIQFLSSRYARSVVTVSTMLLSSMLILTFSRGAWLGVFFGCITIVGLMWFHRQTLSSHQRVFMLVGSVCVIATLGLFHTQVVSRVRAQGRVEQISVTERVSQYTHFFDVFSLNPLFGVGPGAYTFALARIEPGWEVWDYQPIHNLFLLVISELGLLGLLAWLHVVWKIVRMNLSIVKTTEGMFKIGLGIALLVIGSFDHYLWSLWPGLALSALVCSFLAQSPKRIDSVNKKDIS